LTVSRHVTSVGRTIALLETLTGSLPAAGKRVIFEARAPGRPDRISQRSRHHWRALKTKHLFRLPGLEVYEFRVVCEQEPAFPFQRGVSNVVRVCER
jgi:hypothetical protein